MANLINLVLLKLKIFVLTIKFSLNHGIMAALTAFKQMFILKTKYLLKNHNLCFLKVLMEIYTILLIHSLSLNYLLLSLLIQNQ